MALKDILVHIDDTPFCDKRFKIALQIAKQNQAILTGLFARADPNLKGFEPNMAKRHEEHEALSGQLNIRYTKLAEKAGVELVWKMAKLPSNLDQLINQLIQQTQQADLIVVGQYDKKGSKGKVPEEMPEHLVLETGRPVLIIPYAGEFKTIGKKVVVAWAPGRESVRALNDAIPLMREAKKVKVIAINPKKHEKKPASITVEEVAAHLFRHGIKTESDQFSTRGVDEGNLILNCLSDERADLLVMGAYGHHRFRELILGGVTRKIFQHMTTPVLMSH